LHSYLQIITLGPRFKGRLLIAYAARKTARKCGNGLIRRAPGAAIFRSLINKCRAFVARRQILPDWAKITSKPPKCPPSHQTQPQQQPAISCQ